MEPAKNQNHNPSFLPGVVRDRYRDPGYIYITLMGFFSARIVHLKTSVRLIFLGGRIMATGINVLELGGGCRSSEGEQALCGGSFAAD